MFTNSPVLLLSNDERNQPLLAEGLEWTLLDTAIALFKGSSRRARFVVSDLVGTVCGLVSPILCERVPCYKFIARVTQKGNPQQFVFEYLVGIGDLEGIPFAASPMSVRTYFPEPPSYRVRPGIN